MAQKPKIGLGVVTYNRPAYFEASFSAIAGRLHDLVDVIFVYNDGSASELADEYDYICSRFRSSGKITFMNNKDNWGIAHAKNKLLKALMKEKCDYLFIAEDDIVPLNEEAINGYVRISENTGIGHLQFAHHGTLNDAPMAIDGPLSFWPACTGAWTLYTRDCIKRAGFMDERFRNSWEQYELTNRISRLGLTSQFGIFADATGSEQWLYRIAHDDSMSVAINDPARDKNMQEGIDYWRRKDRDKMPQPPQSVDGHPWPGVGSWPLIPR